MALIAGPDRTRLLVLAREALVARVRRALRPRVPADLDMPTAGVFVSLHRESELRGCLGTLDGGERLGEAVVRLAGDVAHHDYRFDPIRIDELDRVVIDLSVLSLPVIVCDPQEVMVGRDGLIIEHGHHKGLLLPQVAPEHGWDRETFLCHTCLKAGLPADAWRNGATVLRFEAEVFGERE